MIRYTALDASIRRDLPHILQLTFFGVGGVTYPFQQSYASFLCSALDCCQQQREKDFKKQSGREFIRDGELPYTAWRLDAGDNLEIFFLRRVNRVAGDVAILKSKTSDSHMVLYGEAMKRNLNEGIADFVVDGMDIKTELRQMINAWDEYAQNIVPNSTEDNRFAPLKYIESKLEQTEPVFLVKTYLYSIEWGDDSIWCRSKYYDYDLQLMGLSDPQNARGAVEEINKGPQ